MLNQPKWISLIAIFFLVFSQSVANADSLEFAEPDFEWLSQGGGSPNHLWTEGDFWQQEFNETGIFGVTGVFLNLFIEDDNALASEDLDFRVLVNGNEIGEFSLLADTAGTYEFGYSFDPITGDDFVFRLEATSTISPGSGSFSLNVGNGNSFVDLTTVPEPSIGFLLATTMLVLRASRYRKEANH